MLDDASGNRVQSGMDGHARKTFVEDGPYAKPEAAARELLRIFRDRLKDGAPYTMTGVTNSEFVAEALETTGPASHTDSRRNGSRSRGVGRGFTFVRMAKTPDAEAVVP